MAQDTITGAEPGLGERQGTISFVRNHVREYGILIALVVIVLFFQIATNGTLLTPLNLTNIILQNSYIIIMALGMLLVIVSGHIDLSVGSTLGFIGALAGVLMINMDMHPFVASVICLAAGFAIGAVQGFWIAYLKVPSFIVTLAGLLILKGATLWILFGASIRLPNEFNALASGFLPDVFDTGTDAAGGLTATFMNWFQAKRFDGLAFMLGVVSAALLFAVSVRNRLSRHSAHEDEPLPVFVLRLAIVCGAILGFAWLMANWQGVPNVLLVMAILFAIYSFLTTKTTFGRRIYAVGGNAKAAKLSGINTERLVFLTFANMGLLAALAGLVFTARLNVAQPKAGQGFELDVIAAVFVGGASMAGGYGTVVGAVVGAFILGVLNNGMSLMSIGIDYQQMIKGAVLLAAVTFDVMNKRNAG